ncbi:MAG: prepilin-type N-terminal cleavage/methylation domain-containing protein [Candidatus Kaiserbacteria bacterium]|nr:prepilin-type N-terminal cleavage/methylation domain-containing protein [Candidatus Kaiserbacteria bacterium]
MKKTRGYTHTPNVPLREARRIPTARWVSGYTLIELMVAVGLFALIMTLVSGAYIMMIGITRQAQGMATGIDNLSFALETMTRTIRTGTDYNDGLNCSGCTSFSVVNASGATINYKRSVDSNGNGSITQNDVVLTDPVVNVTSLTFIVSGAPSSDISQPYVTIIISGTVSYGPKNKIQPFVVETSATMRGTDL